MSFILLDWPLSELISDWCRLVETASGLMFVPNPDQLFGYSWFVIGPLFHFWSTDFWLVLAMCWVMVSEQLSPNWILGQLCNFVQISDFGDSWFILLLEKILVWCRACNQTSLAFRLSSFLLKLLKYFWILIAFLSSAVHMFLYWWFFWTVLVCSASHNPLVRCETAFPGINVYLFAAR